MVNERASEQDDLFIEKHLARNIPVNFMECCERIRMNLRSSKRFWRGLPQVDYHRVYPSMLNVLGYEDGDAEIEDEIGREITEIQVRYEAIQKTLDQSVPAKPVYQTLKSLKLSLARSINQLHDDDRDEIVRFLNGCPDCDEIPSDIDGFNGARSIAERAAISHNLITKFSKDIDELIKFFDYKSGMVTRGNPSKYATLYAVHALANLFEAKNLVGATALVGETVSTNKNAAVSRSFNHRRYTGPYLQFVLAFFHTVDPSELGRRNYEGFADYVRKLAAGRRRDPHLFKLLHGEASVHSILEFMKRADAIK